MVPRTVFLFLLLNHIFASPIESASITDHTDADLDSFELAINFPEKRSPFSLDNTEDSEATSEAASLHEETVAEAPPSQADLEFSERIKNDQIFFEYLKPLRGCTLGTLYRILDKDPNVFPLLNEYDQNNLAFSLTPESFLSPNRECKPFVLVRENNLEFDRNWPQISAERVPMSSLTCQSLKLFLSAVSKNDMKLVKFFLNRELVDVSRPIYSVRHDAFVNFLCYLLNCTTVKPEIIHMIIEHVQTRSPWLMNMQYGDGLSPLHAALKYERNETIDWLLPAGADVNALHTKYGNVAMHAIGRRNIPAIASIAADGKTDLSTVTAEGLDIFDFIRQYRCVEGIDVVMKAKTTIIAGRFFRFIQTVFEENASFGKACLLRILNSSERARIEPDLRQLYIYFTKLGKLEAVQMLTTYHVKPHKVYKDKAGIVMTLLHLAAHYGHRDLILFYLRSGISPSEKNSHQFVPVQLAATTGNWSLVEFILDNTQNAHAQDALVTAIRTKRYEVVRGMMARFVNFDETTIDGQPLWMYAFEKRDFNLFSALLSGHAFDPHYITARGLSLVSSITGDDCASFKQAALRYGLKYAQYIANGSR